MRKGLGFAAMYGAVIAAASAQAPSKSSPANQELPTLIRSTKGSDLFRAYCASCHGADAKGSGPAASALKAKVPNLTLLAKRNGGPFRPRRSEERSRVKT